MSYDGYSDLEIYELLEKANLADMIAEQPEWKLIRVAAERIVDRSIDKLVNETKPDDIVGIIEAQTTIRKYKYGLFEEVEILRGDAEAAFEEAKARGVVSKSVV